MKVIVAGGRDFTNIKLMKEQVLIAAQAGVIDDNSELVCGMARGADMTAYRLWFNIFELPIHKYPAHWGEQRSYNPRAGFIRNEEMARDADVLLAFWDGHSKGTKHMIETMEKLGKPVFVCIYQPGEAQ